MTDDERAFEEDEFGLKKLFEESGPTWICQAGISK